MISDIFRIRARRCRDLSQAMAGPAATILAEAADDYERRARRLETLGKAPPPLWLAPRSFRQDKKKPAQLIEWTG